MLCGWANIRDTHFPSNQRMGNASSLYADDTVLITENVADLQNLLLRVADITQK